MGSTADPLVSCPCQSHQPPPHLSCDRPDPTNRPQRTLQVRLRSDCAQAPGLIGRPIPLNFYNLLGGVLAGWLRPSLAPPHHHDHPTPSPIISASAGSFLG